MRRYDSVVDSYNAMVEVPEGKFVLYDEAENRLLNAFQLVKNGKHIGCLKFEEFKRLMDKHHDFDGNAVA